MRLFLLVQCIAFSMLFAACGGGGEPKATAYKSQLAAGGATAGTPPVVSPLAPTGAGDATKGNTALTASCETAGCHAKVGGGAHGLTKADVAKIDAAGALAFHASAKAAFSSSGADIKAALQAR